MNQSPKQSSYDLVIIGGAKIGSSIAWFLKYFNDFDGTVLVLERDPSYQQASTSHTNSCMRQQFSSELNIKISQFAAEYVNNFRDFFEGDERVPDIHFDSFGYLYLADNDQFAQALKSAQSIQQKCGAATKLLSADEIKQHYPFYQLDDIVLGSLNLVNEGYYDGATVFDWWKRTAQERGAEYCHAEVAQIQHAGDKVNAVVLANGDIVNCGAIVNAAGPRASQVAAMAGLDLPVEPRKRYSFVFQASRPLSQSLPLTIDPTGVHFRSEGQYYLAGCPPFSDHAVAPDDFVEDHTLWDEKVWPAIANRIPQFDALKVINSWVGHYAYNTLDQNAVLGNPDSKNNFYFANGFSGHGFQQAAAVGRGLAELICFGEYRSLDLSALDYSRIETNTPFIEKAVI